MFSCIHSGISQMPVTLKYKEFSCERKQCFPHELSRQRKGGGMEISMKKKIEVMDYAADITKALKKGILLTTKQGEQVNTMSIAWGMLGIQWNKPIFIAVVRESRFTKNILEQNGEFTINIPGQNFDQKIIGYCGSRSGRDVDKIQEMNLTLEEPLSISVPGIRQLPLTLECKVLYKQKQDLNAIPEELLERFYPKEEAYQAFEGGRDYHIAYYGEIVEAYIICD